MAKAGLPVSAPQKFDAAGCVQTVEALLILFLKKTFSQ
jgi:hypothetical protein